MIIRKAKETDMEEIIKLGKDMYDESKLHGMIFDADKCRAFYLVLLATGLAIVAELEGKIIGMFGAELQKHIFSNDYMTMDVLNYVVPSYRGSNAAKRMLSVYVAWAEGHNVKPCNIWLGINAGINVDRTERFYNKLGFNRSGIMMRLKEA